MLVDGVEVEYQRSDGTVAGDNARLVDFDDPNANEWLAVNQFTVVEGQHNRRPDVVVFVNGLPLAVIELKNPANEKATVWSAFNQLQTYKEQIPSLFVYNEALLISDGLDARIGSLSANKERFMPWRTIEGDELAPAAMLQLEVLVRGVFDKARFLQFLGHYIVFEDEGGGKLIKKMAGYHQFHAEEQVVGATRAAARPRWRPEGQGGVAYPGLREESHHGLLCGPGRARLGDGEPDARRSHRPQRSRRSGEATHWVSPTTKLRSMMPWA